MAIKKSKEEIEKNITAKGQLFLVAALFLFLMITSFGQQFFASVSRGFSAAGVVLNNISATDKDILKKFGTTDVFQTSSPTPDPSAPTPAPIPAPVPPPTPPNPTPVPAPTPTPTPAPPAAPHPAPVTPPPPLESAYEITFAGQGVGNLKELKTKYLAYFGPLADTDVIYTQLIRLHFKKTGYVKGKLLPINLIGYVLYMHRTFQMNAQNGDYLNINNLPVDFQFYGVAGADQYFAFYTSKPLTTAFAQYLDIQFTPA